MLKIRLQRLGRKKRPNYRVVLAQSSSAVQGKFLESFGNYDPLAPKDNLSVDTEKIAAWIAKGAQPSNTVARLLKGAGVKGMESFILNMADRKVKNPKEEKAPATPVAETPAVEEKAA